MSEYPITIAEFPARRLTGLKVRTTMHGAQQDCPALWRAFGQRRDETGGAGRDCYGVSVMVSGEAFDYWAAVEMDSSAAAPAGMERIDIPAGHYAKCTVPGLEMLAAAYMYIYNDWPQSQAGYVFDEQAPCFERYPANWQPVDAFEICIPLKKL